MARSTTKYKEKDRRVKINCASSALAKAMSRDQQIYWWIEENRRPAVADITRAARKAARTQAVLRRDRLDRQIAKREMLNLSDESAEVYHDDGYDWEAELFETGLIAESFEEFAARRARERQAFTELMRLEGEEDHETAQTVATTPDPKPNHRQVMPKRFTAPKLRRGLGLKQFS